MSFLDEGETARLSFKLRGCWYTNGTFPDAMSGVRVEIMRMGQGRMGQFIGQRVLVRYSQIVEAFSPQDWQRVRAWIGKELVYDGPVRAEAVADRSDSCIQLWNDEWEAAIE